MSQGGHSEQLLFFALFYQSTPSCLKVIGWVGGVVGWWGGGPCDYCVSPVQRIGFLGFLDLVRIWGLLGQGIGDLDSGLTIFAGYDIESFKAVAEQKLRVDLTSMIYY